MTYATRITGHEDRLARRRPIGAEVLSDRGVDFRVWAPGHTRVEVVLEGCAGDTASGVALALEPEQNGYFSGRVRRAGEGTLYRYQLDGGPLVPDPASRFQPEGPFGPSQVVDASRFRWTDSRWQGPTRHGMVLYEVHVGTLTQLGTWTAALDVLPALARLGVTVLELMPVAEFPGRFGWSYDGVDLYAPYHGYGLPDDMRRFVDRAHALGLAVILDVCYSHLGPAGNFLDAFSARYFSDRHCSEWGRALNFDGEDAGPVREFVAENAAVWVDEFHLDGLRIDATQQIFDASPEHILKVITRAVRAAGTGRRTLVIGESEPQQTMLVRPEEEGGFGVDAIWTDDFHHAAMVAATGRSEGYYADYRGTPQEFISAAKYGPLYQGQYNVRQRKQRGRPALGVEPDRLITYLQNHDQIANSAWGDRIHALTSPCRYRALTALLLLGPGSPLLFQGQEFAATSPFLYFGDQPKTVAGSMHEGRLKFLAQFPSLAAEDVRKRIARPDDPETFRSSKLDPAERERHAEAYALHFDLLRLRREDPTLRARSAGSTDGAVLGPEAFVLRHFGDEGNDRLMLVNLGSALHLDPAPEPLLAPPEQATWAVIWSSEDPRYGGSGTPPLRIDESWWIPSEAVIVLAPRFGAPRRDGPDI